MKFHFLYLQILIISLLFFSKLNSLENNTDNLAKSQRFSPGGIKVPWLPFQPNFHALLFSFYPSLFSFKRIEMFVYQCCYTFCVAYLHQSYFGMIFPFFSTFTFKFIIIFIVTQHDSIQICVFFRLSKCAWTFDDVMKKET